MFIWVRVKLCLLFTVAVVSEPKMSSSVLFLVSPGVRVSAETPS